MVSILKTSVAIWAATVASALAIDFTPHESVLQFDGATFAQLTFADDAFDVSFRPPRGWTYDGAGNAFTLRDPSKDQADEKIVAYKASGAPVVLDAPTITALRGRAQAMIPRGSTNLRFVSEAADGLKIDGHDSYEATFSYGFFGQKFETCVFFAFLGKEQWVVQISAHPDDFSIFYTRAHGSLASFRWTKPNA